MQISPAPAGHRQPGGRTLQPGQAASLRSRACSDDQGRDGEGPSSVPSGVWETAEETGGTLNRNLNFCLMHWIRFSVQVFWGGFRLSVVFSENFQIRYNSSSLWEQDTTLEICFQQMQNCSKISVPLQNTSKRMIHPQKHVDQICAWVQSFCYPLHTAIHTES